MVIGWLSRLLVAAGLVGSAWVHWVVWDDWARFMDVVGPLFMVNVIAGPVIAFAVLLWRGHWLPELAAVGFGLATLGAYVMSLTVGFFDVQEQFRTDEELWGVISEAACVVFGLVLLAQRYAARWRPTDLPPTAGRRGQRRGGLQGQGQDQDQGQGQDQGQDQDQDQDQGQDQGQGQEQGQGQSGQA